MTTYQKDCCENKCQLPHTSKCYWHEDRRKNKNIMYIDGYGDVDVSYYGFIHPVDLYYCPGCKKTAENVGTIIKQLETIMEDPDKYSARITAQKKAKYIAWKKTLNGLVVH